MRPWTLPGGGRVELTDPAKIDAAAGHERLGAVVHVAEPELTGQDAGPAKAATKARGSLAHTWAICAEVGSG